MECLFETGRAMDCEVIGKKERKKEGIGVEESEVKGL